VRRWRNGEKPGAPLFPVEIARPRQPHGCASARMHGEAQAHKETGASPIKSPRCAVQKMGGNVPTTALGSLMDG
jgi:hypothetical protein